ncbi:MAG: chromosomal replication initiator protein DnaA [Actinomycetota bacterium]|nr:chromosomal replication initiator protein DnaA [Actinomycetota bacterium]
MITGSVAKPGSEVWDQALDLIRSRLATPIFRSWFENIEVGGLEANQIVLLVPSRFAKEWIEPRYLPLISGALATASGSELEVLIEVGEPAPGSVAQGPAEVVRPEPQRAEQAALNSRYSFDTYVIGASNRFAHAAALAVAEAPARAYNPLFIYGGVGLGKTHLLHAIGHYVLHTQPGSNIRYVSSEQFTNDFIASVGDPGRIAGFKRRYRESDVLLVDDIQFLESKEATVEEFFHTFNTLFDAAKQIVLTSDRPPKQLGLDERVRSRFEMGLITDVQPPDLETRIAILRKKAGLEGVGHLPDDVLEFIAQRIESNIRELEGALIRVVAFASLDRSQISVSMAESVLKDLYPESGPGSITPELILSETSRYFDTDAEEILSLKRDRALVNARHIAMYLCRELTDLSLPQIGRRFGGRDHSTVMHATNKIRTLMAEKRSTYNQIQELTSRIRTRAKKL